MKTQIRKNIFETNSSSIHSIVIGNNGEDISKNFPEILEFKRDNFGWENAFYNDIDDKANYLYTSIVCCDRLDVLPLIKQILEKWNIKAEFEEINDLSSATVDHAYQNEYLIDLLVEDETLLMNYLFSDGSFVETGNDNEEIDWFTGRPANILLEYEKGN